MTELSWSDLFASGSVFDLDIGRWDRMGNMGAQDLGIDNTAEVRKSFTWGHIKLLPDDFISPVWKVLAAAKRAMESYTVPFPLIPGARFIPATSKKELEAELKKLAEALDERLKEFEAGYQEAMDEHRPTLEAGFRAAAKTPADADAALQKLPQIYPTAAQARAKFYIRWQSYSLASPVDGTFDGDVIREATEVRNALSSMLGKLREELNGKAQEIAGLVANGGKITEKTYNATRRLCDKIDRITTTFADPVLVRASKALRAAVDSASDDADAKETILKGGVSQVVTELRVSVEESMATVEAMLVGGRRELL